MPHEIKFLPEGKRSEVPMGTTLMDAALRSGADLETICGGKGFCGKCLIEVISGELSPVTDVERKRVPPERLAKGYRLACQALTKGDVVVRVPDQSRVGRQRLVIMGSEPNMELNSNVEKVHVEMPPTAIRDPKADDDRLLAALAARGHTHLVIDYSAAKALPRILREAGWNVTATIVSGKVIGAEPADTSGSKFGVAVDIGTTKLAVFIVDLNDGAIAYAGGGMNPQIRFGEDVISRINYASQGEEHLGEIHDCIVNGINELIIKGMVDTGIRKEVLYELVAVGNTAMHHLFAGVHVKSLGLAPYPAGLGLPYDIRAADMGLEINPSGNVHLLPNVAGFVGADAIADVLACRLHEKEKLTLLLDVGTNTEVMLGDMDGIWSCSTASGPAFEGAHIRCGMRAATGSIEKVRIGEGYEVSYRTIDDEKPRGICGSGMIDAMSEMLKSGVLDTSGRIVACTSPRVREGDGGMEFVLAFKGETGTGKEDIVITQDDVREVQKAKAAIYAGCMTLMRKSGFKAAVLNEIIIAGAFGNYIDPGSARTIGMIPELPLERVSFTGNSAGSGARMCLKSVVVRREAHEVAEKMRYVELAAEPIFEEEYINAMYMPNSRLEEFPETMNKIKAQRVVRRYVRRD